MIPKFCFILIIIAVSVWQHVDSRFVVGNDDYNRIVGGQNASPGEFPWQVSIHYYGKHACGGSIIDANWIITAANCVERLSTDTMEVLAGKNNINIQEGTEQRVSVEKIIMHPEFEKDDIDFSNDIALLKLAHDLELNSFVQPIRIPTQDKQEFTGFCTSTGWGMVLKEGVYVYPDILQKVLLPVVTDEECKEVYHHYKVIESMMCTHYKDGGKSTSLGDGGGPLVCTGEDKVMYLAGITSWGLGYGMGAPDVYTQVSYFIRWIESTKIANS